MKKGKEGGSKEICTQIAVSQDAIRKIPTQDVYCAFRKKIEE